ncbi:MAG: SH3 domain-containing protein [Xanthobacteraceae bacterium]|jgi:hypothetical protein
MSVGKITAFGVILCSTVWAQCALAQDPGAPPPPGLPPGAAPPPDAAAPPPPGAGAPPPAVIGTNVNLRQGPGTTYTVITLIPAGSPVNVGGCKGGWCQISYQGQNGYIIATALAPPGGPGGPPPGAVAGGPPPGYIPPPPPYYYGYYGPYYGPYYGGPYGRRGYYHRHW